ncbi:MAG TPA: helicase-related protein [bacterium]|nr:helicase-related protein [bacterium]HOL34470.1 helicase-related protein [bacterium]
MNDLTIPDIIDNQTVKLSDVLNQLIGTNSSVYIATAYFNLEGFNLIRDKIKQAKEVKILIGKEPSSDQILTREVIEAKIQQEIEDKIDDKSTVNLIDEFLSFLNNQNVEIKIFKGVFFHGKFYIISGGIPTVGSIAIVGSSNLTYAGLTVNTEFNSVIKQEASVEQHKQAFHRMFNNLQTVEDYKQKLSDLCTRFTKQYNPYDVYMKILYSYFEDRLSESPTEEMPSPILLADFQRDGYIFALQSIEKYGGVLLADSVGLGKTYLALRLLEDFAYRLRQKALIICPAQIRDTLWEPKLREFCIRADIISQEQVSRDFEPDRFKDYDLILIDESHNFRNANTIRWKNLFKTIVQSEKKIILITATPVNNSVFDLYNQLRFITKDKDEFFKPAGVNSLWGYFLRAKENNDTLYDLLEEIAVRRSRQFIKKLYPDAKIDGEPVKFPERLLYTIKYKLTDVYFGLYDECIKVIESLSLASYNVQEFRKEIFNRRLQKFEEIREFLKKQGWLDKNIQNYLMEIGRNQAVIGLLKILLLKRLESSIESFKISVKNLIDFQRKFLELIEKNRILDKESYRKFLQFQSEDENQEGFIENLDVIDPAEYEVDEIIRKTKNDISLLENLYEKLIGLDGKDTKLEKLISTLQELKGKKIIIFGYFKDTMRYMYRELIKNEVLQKLNIDKEKISIVDSDVSSDERKNRIIRFSPQSNEGPESKEKEEIQILLSTDVLSEGQNLQDADTLINYDLPWNPVKIIQRVGRIDRIGSPHSKIYVYNFFPEDELESVLRLLQRLSEKLDEINRSVGLDVSIFGETPAPKDFGYIRKISNEDNSVLDELEGISELAVGEFLKEEILNYLQSEGTEKIKKIPNGIGSSIRKENKRGVFIAFKDDERHYWCFYDLENKKIIEDRLECIKIIKCEKDEAYYEPPSEIKDKVYEVIKEVKNHILARLKTAQVKPQVLKSPQSQVVAFLKQQRDVDNSLMGYFSTPLPEIYLKDLKTLWKNSKGFGNKNIIDELKKFKDEHPMTLENQIEGEKKEYKLKLITYMIVSP